ncbi:MAG TPA: glycoside hydrolase family 2 protein, partial [Rectinemataceae bacterium]|nr:glycoside hydrolase family 2 protein [Rectinemataceae bacterium]
MREIGLEGTWRLIRLADGSSRGMELPGDILSALVASGEAADPYWDRNELGLQWIGREDWLIEREFDLDEGFLAHPRIVLDISVLDTVAEIRVNGEPVGGQANMFRGFRAELGDRLRPGRNHISITIRSPERAAALAASALPYPVPYSAYPVSSPHRNLIRKAQCMSGWDWGPCLMTGGIYDGISLIATGELRIEWLSTKTERAPDGAWKLKVEAGLNAPELLERLGSELEVELELELAGNRALRRLSIPRGDSRASIELLVPGVEDWWPAGYGGQRLYELTLSCRAAGGGPVSHVLRKRIGFRELVVRAEEDEVGRGMVFVANGVEVFCKGANWIPADALPSRWTRERLASLLDSAVQANMNCLRVWGGGRYESDAFYELCDERGIMVWQDCMFSCALYPSSPAFLAEVEAEISHQVRRLKDHPCLALWCGNNEALGAINWYPESKASPARYIADYDRLTEGVLGRVIRELDPDRTWWPSSPSAGPNDWSDNWHSDSRGDMHFWSVWHEGKPFSDYLGVRPRFCSEFGFQSYPSYRQTLAFCPPDQLNVTSPAMEHHQRHPRGNGLILETMSRYFRMPKGFRETLYLSQVQQALAIRTAVEYWRSLRPRCMGS